MAAAPKPVEVETKVDFKAFDYSLVETIQKILLGDVELNSFNDFGNIHYNLLDKLNLIQFTTDEKMEIFNLAKEVVKDKFYKKNISLIEQGRSIQIVDTERLLNQIETSSKTTNDIIVIEAKKIAFCDFLSRIEDGEKFIQELTQKIEEHYGNK